MNGRTRLSSARRAELVSLAERTTALQLVRAAIAAVVLTAAATMPEVVGAPLRALAPIVACYAVFQGVAEVVRRLVPGQAIGIIGATVLIDGTFLAATLTRSGGPSSVLAFLVSLHVVAVSLLVSYRAGLRLTVWYTLLFLIGHYARRAGLVTNGGHGPIELSRIDVLGVLALWFVALATAACSSLNERELRRGKAELTHLAAMSARLQSAPLHELGTVVEDGVRIAFNARRVAVVEAAHVAGDAVAGEALADGAPILVRALDPVTDPGLSEALPRATDVAVVPLVAGAERLGVLAVERGGRWRVAGLPARTVVALEQFATHAALAWRNALLTAELDRLATTDGLTGLTNRRVFDDALAREVAASARDGRPLALVVIDVDHFKVVNDTHGHQAGDDVLRGVAAAVRSVARSADVAARFGGEEFVLLLPGCRGDEAVAVAERVRAAVADAGGPIAVTASAGVACLGDEVRDSRDLLRAADDAMYEAKRAGRDRTVLATARRSSGVRGVDRTGAGAAR